MPRSCGLSQLPSGQGLSASAEGVPLHAILHAHQHAGSSGELS
jgi:hypothetical protein